MRLIPQKHTIFGFPVLSRYRANRRFETRSERFSWNNSRGRKLDPSASSADHAIGEGNKLLDIREDRSF